MKNNEKTPLLKEKEVAIYIPPKFDNLPTEVIYEILSFIPDKIKVTSEYVVIGQRDLGYDEPEHVNIQKNKVAISSPLLSLPRVSKHFLSLSEQLAKTCFIEGTRSEDQNIRTLTTRLERILITKIRAGKIQDSNREKTSDDACQIVGRTACGLGCAIVCLTVGSGLLAISFTTDLQRDFRVLLGIFGGLILVFGTLFGFIYGCGALLTLPNKNLCESVWNQLFHTTPPSVNAQMQELEGSIRNRVLMYSNTGEYTFFQPAPQETPETEQGQQLWKNWRQHMNSTLLIENDKVRNEVINPDTQEKSLLTTGFSISLRHP